VGDLLTFAQFHMGDGTCNGERILSEASLWAMQTVQVKAANFAEAYGLGWAVQDIDGTTVLGHSGSTNGFQAKLRVVPSHGFAIAVLTNSSRGGALNDAVTKWALERYCGLRERALEQIELPDERLKRLAGVYTNPQGEITLSVQDDGLRREMRTKKLLNDNKEEQQPPDLMRPIADAEFVVVTEGENKGSRVDFIQSGDGQPRFVRVGGRLFDRAG
jgi:CubicO group peptidase (beta-lactamase class C family)